MGSQSIGDGPIRHQSGTRPWVDAIHMGPTFGIRGVLSASLSSLDLSTISAIENRPFEGFLFRCAERKREWDNLGRWGQSWQSSKPTEAVHGFIQVTTSERAAHLNLFSTLWPLVMNPSRLGMGLKIRLSSDMRLNRFVTTCYNGVGMRYELGDAPDVSDAATRETSAAKILRQCTAQCTHA